MIISLDRERSNGGNILGVDWGWGCAADTGAMQCGISNRATGERETEARLLCAC